MVWVLCQAVQMPAHEPWARIPASADMGPIEAAGVGQGAGSELDIQAPSSSGSLGSLSQPGRASMVRCDRDIQGIR